MSTGNERLLKSLEEEFNRLKITEPQKVELDLSDPVTFTEKYVSLPEKAEVLGNKTWFNERPWLPPLYRDESNRIIIVKGRQMEISEYAVNMIFYNALKRPGKYVYASASGSKSNIFSRDRFQKQLARSPILQSLATQQAVERIKINKSEIYFLTAFEDTKTLRSIDADFVVLDEFQDYRANAIPIVEPGLSHNPYGKLLVIGTPLLTGTNFSDLWDGSSKQEWNKETSQWEAANPNSDKWIGYHISQEMAVGVWMTQADIDYKRAHEPRQQFMNEVLGHFYSGLGRPTDRAYMLTLFSPAIQKGSFGVNDFLLAGVDWGVSKANTVFFLIRPRILELPDIYTIDVLYVEKIDYPDLMKQIDRVASLLNTYPASLCVLDYGSGFVQNQALYKKFPNRIMQIRLGAGRVGVPVNLESTQFGMLANVNRTWALDMAMDYVTKPERFRFYNEEDTGTKDWIIKDFLSEYPEVSKTTGQKMWIHNPDTTDDALMAFVNAMVGFHLKKAQGVSGNPNEWISFV